MPSPVVTEAKSILDVLIQLLILVVPVALSWFIRNYLKNSSYQPKFAAIATLANSAIDYAENLDKSGRLQVSPGLSKGLQKLDMASNWMMEELDKNGIKMTTDQAKNWVSSEFQKRQGSDASQATKLNDITNQAVNMILNLARNSDIAVPPEMDRFSYLASLASDWVVTQMAQQGLSLDRDLALIWVRAALFSTLHDGDLPSNDKIANLAKDAVAFVNARKAKGPLPTRPGTNPLDAETDLATAWMITEAAKQGFNITPEQILQAVTAALQQANNNPGAGSPSSPPLALPG